MKTYVLTIRFRCEESNALKIAQAVQDAASQDGLDGGAEWVNVGRLEEEKWRESEIEL